MTGNYLKWIFRNIFFNKFYSLINILGLSIGLAGAFFILIFIINETSYDKHQKENVYRVLKYDSTFEYLSPHSPFILAEILKNEIPDVKYASSMRRIRKFNVEKGEDAITETMVYGADPDIFEILKFDFIYGNNTPILNDKNDVIISDKIARKYFGEENPEGKCLNAIISGEKKSLIVKGVYEDYPRLSTISPEIIISSDYAIAELLQTFPDADYYNAFDNSYFETYVLINNKKDVENKLSGIENKYLNENQKFKFSLQSIDNFYLGSGNIVNNHLPIGNLKNVYLFLIIVITILVVAIFNYLILSSALMINRNKEIGVRKIVGANKQTIFIQLIGETSAIIFISAVIGYLIVVTNINRIQTLFSINVEYSIKGAYWYFIAYVIIVLVLALIAGSIIAFRYSKVNPIDLLKQKFKNGNSLISIRSVLIVIQLAVFVGLLSMTLLVKKQISYMVNKNPGFNKENLLILNLDNNLKKKYNAFKQELINHPAILDASGAFFLPPTNSSMRQEVQSPDNPDNKAILEYMAVGFDFIETLGIKVVEGRSFNPEIVSDSSGSVILNESAVKELSLNKPLNKIINNQEVIGVIEDFNLHSMHSKIPPLAINIVPDNYIYKMVIRYNSDEISQLLSFVEKKWHEFSPESKPDYYFYNDVTKAIYSEENQLSKILVFFTSCSILISLLGLYGLTIFIAEKRVKEIGIRKVLGAQKADIIMLLSKGFVNLVVIASLIAWPIVFYLMKKWLNKFSYKTPIEIWLFVGSSFIALILIIIITSCKALRVTNYNITETLRYE
ncbi:MAG: ABC transporter permease [Bacteroidales bacterium]|nr:ABC transporter permease [Bacteroidales bacterium]